MSHHDEIPQHAVDLQSGTKRRSFILKLAALGGLLLPLKSALGDTRNDRHDRLDALQQEIDSLKLKVGLLEDLNDICKLQHAYGYYLDKCLYEEVTDLYADDGEVRFMGGIWKGKAGVRRLYVGVFGTVFTDGKNAPVPGFLLDHPQLQDVIDVAPDRSAACARFRSPMQAGVHVDSDAPMARRGREQGTHPRQWWEGGIYENEYRREDGVWKIRRLNYNPVWHADFETGWAHTRPEYIPAYAETWPDNPNGPDELDKNFLGLWPNTETIPFHYPHPVTGEPWS